MEVGEQARKQLFVSSNAVGRFQREMGTSTTYNLGGKTFTPTQLSAILLKKLVQDAESSLGEIREAVITIPANFAHEAREATMAAAKQAGLNVKFIINEPTAAALYYAFKSGEELSGVYAVYDLGSGTFDVSIIRANGYDVEVLATDGVQRLGGDDFDAALEEIVAQKYLEKTGETLPEAEYNKNRAEEEKKSLSRRPKVLVRAGGQTLEGIDNLTFQLNRNSDTF